MSYQHPQSEWQPNPYAQSTPRYDYGQQPPQPMAPYGYTYPPQQPKKGFNGVVIALIVGAVAIVFMVFVAPFIFIGEMSSDVDELISESTGGNTEQILADLLDVNFGTFTRDSDYTTIRRGKLPVTIRNKGSERASYHIQIEAVDAAGNRIAEDTAYVANLAAGQSVTEDAFKLTGDDDYDKLTRATFKVAGVSKY
jgi:hypothetical protein